jgi:hypothetical protein
VDLFHVQDLDGPTMTSPAAFEALVIDQASRGGGGGHPHGPAVERRHVQDLSAVAPIDAGRPWICFTRRPRAGDDRRGQFLRTVQRLHVEALAADDRRGRRFR